MNFFSATAVASSAATSPCLPMELNSKKGGVNSSRKKINPRITICPWWAVLRWDLLPSLDEIAWFFLPGIFASNPFTFPSPGFCFHPTEGQCLESCREKFTPLFTLRSRILFVTLYRRISKRPGECFSSSTQAGTVSKLFNEYTIRWTLCEMWLP